jgi:hypothetical protein
MPWEKLLLFFSRHLTDLSVDALLLLTILIGWRNYRYLTASGLMTFAFATIAFLLSVATWVVAYQNQKNHFLYTLQALAELGCFGFFYLIEIKTPSARRVLAGLMVAYAVAFVGLFDQNQMNDVLIGVARLLLMGFVLTYFWFLLTDMKVPNLLAHPPFWVSIAVLLNGAGTVFIFLFNRMTLTSGSRNDYYIWYRGVTLVFLALFYILLAYSLWLNRRAGSSAPRRPVG